MESSRGQGSGDKNRRILIVDDNYAIHDDFRKILSAASSGGGRAADLEAELFAQAAPARLEGFELVSAYQGEQAYQAVLNALEVGQPFAMSFVDMRMPPGWDGLQTIAKMWEVDPELQIVI